jgi:hypothetical protein
MLRIEHGGSAYGARLITDQPFSRGGLIYRITGHRLVHQPTYQTIQISAAEHIEELGVVAYLNHSCRPNTFVDTAALTVTAARDIAAGEELTFFYPSTEWEMDRPFVCLCGAPQCIRLVAGAKYLSVDTLSRYFINRHIHQLIVNSLTHAMAEMAS